MISGSAGAERVDALLLAEVVIMADCGARAPSRSSTAAASLLPGSRSSVKARLRARYSCPERRASLRAGARADRRTSRRAAPGAAVVAVAGAGVEEGIAAEECGESPWARRHTCAIVCPGVSRHSSSTVRPTRITSLSRGRGRLRRCAPLPRRVRAPSHRSRQRARVTAGVIEMFVGVQDLGDGKTTRTRHIEAFAPLERVDRERLAALLAAMR